MLQKLDDVQNILRANHDLRLAYLTKQMNKLSLEFHETEDRSTWDYASFVYFKSGLLSIDINNDGYPEVAIATYDNGNSVDRSVLIYPVKPDSVEFYKEESRSFVISRKKLLANTLD